MPAAQAIGFATAPFYTQVCGGIAIPNAFKVDESGGSIFGHFHIAADDPTVNCFTTNATWPSGVMGRQIGAGPCVAINPLTTSRYVAVHTTTQWIRVRTASTTKWRATQIKVMGTVSVKVLVEQTDGTWWQFTDLTPGIWNLGNTGKFAKNAFVQNQSTAGAPMSFDNFVVAHNL